MAIKERLGDLSTHDLEAHFAIETGPVEDRWRRVLLHPDLELHVRERGGRDDAFARAVDTIVQHARWVIDSLEERR